MRTRAVIAEHRIPAAGPGFEKWLPKVSRSEEHVEGSGRHCHSGPATKSTCLVRIAGASWLRPQDPTPSTHGAGTGTGS
jgi:hypothetical protein